MDQELRVGPFSPPADASGRSPGKPGHNRMNRIIKYVKVLRAAPAARQLDRSRFPAASLVVTYLVGPASPMRVAVSVVPVLLASTRTTSLVAIWVVVAVCLPLWTLVLGSSA